MPIPIPASRRLRPPARLAVLALVLGLCAGAADGFAARDETYSFLKIFNEVLLLIRNNYVEETEVGGLMHGAYDGLLATLDPSSEYLSRAQYERLIAALGPEEGDVGLDLSRRGGYLYVVSALPGSPAAQAGLSPGTRLRRIDGRSTREMTLTEALLALRGPVGSEVVAQRFPDRSGAPEQVPLKRAKVLPPPPAARRVDGTAVLTVSSVPPGTAAMARRTLRSLAPRPDEPLLLDLRGASTGDYGEAAKLASLFVAPGPAGKIRDRAGEERPFTIEPGERTAAGRLVLLIDGGTAGAAEFLVQILMSRGGAEAVGSKTNGRGTVQSYLTLQDGGVLRLSVARCLGPDGENWDGKGITPGTPIEAPAAEAKGNERDEDTVLRKALEIVRAPAAAAA